MEIPLHNRFTPLVLAPGGGAPGPSGLCTLEVGEPGGPGGVTQPPIRLPKRNPRRQVRVEINPMSVKELQRHGLAWAGSLACPPAFSPPPPDTTHTVHSNAEVSGGLANRDQTSAIQPSSSTLVPLVVTYLENLRSLMPAIKRNFRGAGEEWLESNDRWTVGQRKRAEKIWIHLFKTTIPTDGMEDEDEGGAPREEDQEGSQLTGAKHKRVTVPSARGDSRPRHKQQTSRMRGTRHVRADRGAHHSDGRRLGLQLRRDTHHHASEANASGRRLGLQLSVHIHHHASGANASEANASVAEAHVAIPGCDRGFHSHRVLAELHRACPPADRWTLSGRRSTNPRRKKNIIIIQKEYQTTETLTDAARRRMVNILVALIIDKHGYHPTKAIREDYAHGIVVMFPKGLKWDLFFKPNVIKEAKQLTSTPELRRLVHLEDHLRNQPGRQPYLLVVWQQKSKIDRFYITVDKRLIPCKANRSLWAFDELFKAHFLFNFSYDVAHPTHSCSSV
ncbi:hypothetical protein FQN60_009276 [Etheostoma spectabile]|uniref:Uncharacterized protein n=1 Tax=Etheostoma spectabile TaxID=54343 RepID=A0A5J5DIV9_9PERO|nr:hypothetical protein FQN60_009276 [Etheostoma spectabile]